MCALQVAPEELGDGAKRAAALQNLVQNLMDAGASPDDVGVSSYPLYDDHTQVRTALQPFPHLLAKFCSRSFTSWQESYIFAFPGTSLRLSMASVAKTQA